jgi:hypothetical protein
VPADAGFKCDKDVILGAVVKEKCHICHLTQSNLPEDLTLHICVGGAECFVGNIT